ncbi:MAG: Ig-like domain-containing protein [Bacteroidia bacterium]|nr:Ig-like domain-containing protein [Bacteroidia bacterium]
MMKNLIFLHFILLGTLVFAQDPYVRSTFPVNKSENLSCSTPIFFTVEFSVEGSGFRQGTFKKENIKLYPKGKSKKLIDIVLGYNTDIQKVIVTPQELLEGNTWYVMEFSRKFKDNRGKPFLPYKLEFKTGNCPGNENNETLNEAKAIGNTPVNLNPIKITSFKAEKFNDSVKISWTAKESLLTEGYFVEKSTDNQLYTYLGAIPALGDLEEDLKYSFYDSYPNSGEAYYRLGVKLTLDETRILDTVEYFTSGVKFLDRRVKQDEELPLLFYSKKPTSMVFVLKEPDTKMVVFRQAKLLPQGKYKIGIELNGVEKGLYIAYIQTTEIAVKTKIQVE